MSSFDDYFAYVILLCISHSVSVRVLMVFYNSLWVFQGHLLETVIFMVKMKCGKMGNLMFYVKWFIYIL